MRTALDTRPKGPVPTLDSIVEKLGAFTSANDGTGENTAPARKRRGNRRVA